MKKKIIFFSLALIIILSFCFFSFWPVQARVNNLEELKVRLDELSKQLHLLQDQLRAWMSDTGLSLPERETEEKPAEPKFCYQFDNNLRFGDKGEEVENLQKALREEGLYNHEITGQFDERTFLAVKSFQEKYHEGVLMFWRLRAGTGFVGQTTRAKLNELYGCKPEPEKEISGQNLEVSITTDKEYYRADEEITIVISAENQSSDEIILNFNTSCQTWYSLGNFSNREAVCLQVLTEITIPADEKHEWQWKHSLTEHPLDSGSHAIQGGVIGYQTAGASITVE